MMKRRHLSPGFVESYNRPNDGVIALWEHPLRMSLIKRTFFTLLPMSLMDDPYAYQRIHHFIYKLPQKPYNNFMSSTIN